MLSLGRGRDAVSQILTQHVKGLLRQFENFFHLLCHKKCLENSV